MGDLTDMMNAHLDREEPAHTGVINWAKKPVDMHQAVWSFDEVGPHFFKAHGYNLPPNVKFHLLHPCEPTLPHDHPLDMTTVILFGGYTERRYNRDGSFERIKRNPGDKFIIEARTIHTIVDFHGGVTVTASTYGPLCNTWSEFQWRDGEIWHRPHNETEWKRGDSQ